MMRDLMLDVEGRGTIRGTRPRVPEAIGGRSVLHAVRADVVASSTQRLWWTRYNSTSED